jgi:hypothetical protein
VSRSCARPGCAETAVATLSYAYADGVVVLDDLAAEAHPMVHDLCRAHAEGLRVPRGWELQDERSIPSPPAGRDHADPYGQLDLIGA